MSNRITKDKRTVAGVAYGRGNNLLLYRCSIYLLCTWSSVLSEHPSLLLLARTLICVVALELVLDLC